MEKGTIKKELRAGLYRRRYLVPNLVTVGNLFCGFIAIIYASSGRYEKAVIAILIAILLDGLDGRVARRLNATSKFGVEFDSFSDLVSFGVAPAMLVYHWGLLPIADEFGVFVTFLYAICAASRLARFNVAPANLAGFEGLPSPAAAAAVTVAVNFNPRIEPSSITVAFSTGLMLLFGYLMVSKVPYQSIKKLKFGGMNFYLRLGLGALVALVWYKPYLGALLLAFGYAMSGPLFELLAARWPQLKKQKEDPRLRIIKS